MNTAGDLPYGSHSFSDISDTTGCEGISGSSGHPSGDDRGVSWRHLLGGEVFLGKSSGKMALKIMVKIMEKYVEKSHF